MSAIKYRPEVDGLRAVAVLPVILFHLGLAWVPGGFVGVDVFFVISGFLITSIIVKEQQQGKFTLAAFWTRRARRILPALLTVIFVTLVANAFLGYRNAYSSQAGQALSALFSFANIYMWRAASDYWGPGAESLSFLHCWSLSVEEQFYFFYPVLLVWLLNKKKQWVLPAVALLVVVSLLLFGYAYSRIPGATFYLLPTRMWELGAGCLLALLTPNLSPHLPRWYSPLLASLGLALIVASYVFLPGETISPKVIIPVLGAVLLIGFSQATVGVGRLLSLPAVVYIGSISYSLYIWHWPVIVLARTRNPLATSSAQGVGLLLAIIFFLSILSYHLIEAPLRRSPLTLKVLPVGFAACLLAIGLGRFTTNSLGNAYDTSAFNRSSFLALEYDVKPERKVSSEMEKTMYGVENGSRPADYPGAFAKNGIVKRYGGPVPDVLVLGDSHGVMWAPVIDDVCREKKLTVSFFVTTAVPPFIKLPLGPQPYSSPGFSAQQKRQFDQRRLECIKQWKPLVILSSRWSNHKDLDETQDLIEYIGRCGCKVVLVEQPPEVMIGANNAAQYLSFLGYSPSEKGHKQLFAQFRAVSVEEGRTFLRQLTQKYPFCQILKTYDCYASDNKNASIINGRDILYIDEHHLSTNGAFLARSRFAQAISG